MLFRRASGTRRAVTLIEAVLFIAIALSLIVGGLVFYQQAQTARQTQETVRLVTALVMEARALYSSAPPESVTNIGPVLIASGAVPSRYIDQSSNSIVAPWGDRIGINAGPQTEPAFGYTRNTLGVTFERMPPKVCVRTMPFDADGEGVFGSGIEYTVMNGIHFSLPYAREYYPYMELTGSESFIGMSSAKASEDCFVGEFASIYVSFGWK
jgi:hypothetical protein